MIIKKSCIRIGITFFLLLLSIYSKCQTDYSWWNEKHNWDGYNHWSHYMIISPSYLGPNALPVPDLYDGKLLPDSQFEMGLEGHYSKGDQTANLYTEFYLPLFTDRAALQLQYRPIEVYTTDTITRDERRSREYDPTGISSGDVYASTFIQIIKDHVNLPDILISIGIKTTSGTKVDGARHTDAPGYWFDATFGKKIKIENPSIDFLRIYGKAGFLVYQTLGGKHRQNDTFLFGAGLSMITGHLIIQNQVTGFAGYLNNGDVPVVYRLIVEGKTEKKITYKFRFEQGLHDFPYTSLRISGILKFNNKFKGSIETHD